MVYIEPGIKYLWGDFDMVLYSISTVTIAECLVFCMLVGCQENGSRRQIEGILMPVEDLSIARQSFVERITCSLSCKWHLKETDLWLCMPLYNRTKCTC